MIKSVIHKMIFSLAIFVVGSSVRMPLGFARSTRSTVEKDSARVEAELVFSGSMSGSTESFRLLRSNKPKSETSMLVYRWGETDLHRQVLTESWAKEVRADFDALSQMSAPNRKTLGSVCTEPVQVSSTASQAPGWFCDSSLSPKNREVWRSILVRLRHVATQGWGSPTTLHSQFKDSKAATSKAPRKN